MPKLPDAMDLGALPSARSGRGVATYDTTAIGRGQEALGASIMSGAQVEGAANQQLANAGFKAATVGLSYAEDQQKKADELNDAKAYADLQVRTAQVDAARDDESDPEKLKDYKNNYQNAIDMSASVITDPGRQELFKAKHQQLAELGQIKANDRSFAVQQDASKADTMRQLNDLQDAGLKTTDEGKRAAIVKSGQNLINKLEEAEYITAVDAEKMRQGWVQGYAVKAISAMRPEDRINLLRAAPGTKDEVLDRIGGVESGGDPNARAATSSALGTFQFTKGTWADMIAANRPDLAKGRSTAELTNDPLIQNLRTDPKLSREMAGALLDRNAAQLKAAGIETTPGNLYLAHFLGPGDAVKVLKAAPGTPVTSVVNADSIDANQSVLAGKTVDTVTNWANRKMGGVGPKDAAGVHGFIPEALKPQIVDQAYKDMHADDVDAQRLAKAQADQAKAVSDQVEGDILKDLYSDKPTMTVRDIVNNPQLTREAKERMITRAQSALAEDKTDKTYGKGFFDAYQKVHAPDGTEGKITDSGQLYARVGPNGPNDLTVAGVDKLKAEIEARRSPEGVSEGLMRTQFLKNAHVQISGQDDGLKLPDPKGEQLFLKFQAQVLPAYDAARKAGKSAAQLLDPDSPDYIGKSIKQFARPRDEWYSDMVTDKPGQTVAAPAFDVSQIKSQSELVAAYRAGKISRTMAREISNQKGWFPETSPSAPVSQ